MDLVRRMMLWLLTQPVLTTITFRHLGCVIDRAAWEAVRVAISDNRILIEPAGLSAISGYNAERDTFCMQPSLFTVAAYFPSDCATAAHELAHAAADMQAIAALSSADSELIAYVTEEAFRLRQGLPNDGPGVLNVGAPPLTQAWRSPLHDALVAARSLASFVLAHPGASLQAPTVAIVRDALGRDPTYRRQFAENTVTSNGLRRPIVS